MIAARHRTMELMDQPELDPNLHVAALTRSASHQFH